MKTFVEKQKNALLRKFHAMLTRAGVSMAEKEALLASYGVESSKQLNVYELTEICAKLDKIANPVAAESDRWRKRLIAAVDGYLRAMGKKGGNMAEIKAVACRAAKIENFNRIPVERLKSLYNAFKYREKDLKTINQMTSELLLSAGLTVQGEA